jgi:hypothetical protein
VESETVNRSKGIKKYGRGLSRRQFLSTFASTAAGIAISESSPAALAQYARVRQSGELSTPGLLVIEGAGYRILIDKQSGSIAALQATYTESCDLLAPNHVSLPLLTIELRNDKGEFQTIDSSQARVTDVHDESHGGERNIVIRFLDMGGLPVDATVHVNCPAQSALTYWSFEVKNGTQSWIGHIQFPYVKVPFDEIDGKHLSNILWSVGDGGLAGPVTPTMKVGGWWSSRRNTPEAWRFNNYPGQWASTQLMAYYKNLGGLYLACDDNAGLPKFIDPLMEDDGVTLGLAHYPGTRGPGTYHLPYHVVMGTFHGDWYAAAEIYRDWASKQPFCSIKLADRKDVPKWVLESPVGIMFPMRGQCDWDGPARENQEFSPATNAIPYLEKISAGLDAPLMPLVFNWEHAGPWVQPDAYPPVGGEGAMKEFMAKARAKGWSPGVYGDGLNWVTSQVNTGYDGMPYFHANDGEAAMAYNWDGEPLGDRGVGAWRTSYNVCVATARASEMVLGMTKGMAEFGPSLVQQFDQGPGPKACYSSTHGHPPVPGPWMISAFESLLRKDTLTARAASADVAMSCEGAPPEVFLRDFQIWDARIRNCPLYSFIYHEYGNGHEGLYTNRISDETLRLSIARALVTGYMTNFTLRDKGLIEYDWDQPWTRAIPDQAAILDWANRAQKMRKGLAKSFLVYGRMLRPWQISNVTMRDFGWGQEAMVQSGTWQAADGRIGIVLANFSDLGERPRVLLQGEGTKKVSLWIDGDQKSQMIELPTDLNLELLPRSFALVEINPD